MSDLPGGASSPEPAARILVDLSCPADEAELVVDALFELGASAVQESAWVFDAGTTKVGSASASTEAHLSANLPASVAGVVRDRWYFASIRPAPPLPPQVSEAYVVGGRLVVRPSAVSRATAMDGLAAGWVELVVDPGGAFGSGTHPTTRGCLAEVLRLADAGRLDGADVLDVGCGSGVLGLAARALGARRLVAEDTDPAATAATAANVRTNALTSGFSARSSLDGVGGGFGVVLANLLAPVFDEIGGQIAATVAPGGVLVASGVLEDQVERVLVVAPDLVVERRTTLDDGWVVLTLTRHL
ncbi:MAG: 50S ribosomal protein L11 methyltransferase [Actinomycetes bacterium]